MNKEDWNREKSAKNIERKKERKYFKNIYKKETKKW